jgi:formylglycine-generating enzyme required for sulfatase activity
MYYQQRNTTAKIDSEDHVLISNDRLNSEKFRSDAWFLPDDDLFGFVEIAGGPFIMGSDPNVDPLAFDNERLTTATPQGTVNLSTYFISRYEVTSGQFLAFVKATGFQLGPRTLSTASDHPAVNVSWPDALAYCRWLDDNLRTSHQTPQRLKDVLNGGWRIGLPSEAEWEKAARGTDGRIYPWGDTPRRDRANYQFTHTLPVGSLDCPECPFGLSDMSGNVWEWTRTPYHQNLQDSLTAQVNLDAPALWVMRGGHYGDPPQYVRTAIRGGADPGARRAFIGFRLVISRF